MIRVYPAGPISSPSFRQVLKNLRAGQKITVDLLSAGYAAFPVFCDFHLSFHRDIQIEIYKKNSIAWLQMSDAVLVTGKWKESQGCIDEIREAEKLNIPVFFKMEDLCRMLPPK